MTNGDDLNESCKTWCKVGLIFSILTTFATIIIWIQKHIRFSDLQSMETNQVVNNIIQHKKIALNIVCLMFLLISMINIILLSLILAGKSKALTTVGIMSFFGASVPIPLLVGIMILVTKNTKSKTKSESDY